MPENRRMFFIAGPTASGKTEIAIEVALRCNAEIIGADAFQIYEGMEILTAKPTPEQLARVPHHLVGSVERQTAYDVASYLQAATHCAAQISKRERLPLVVGGTGLYLRALMRGLADLPTASPELRAQLESVPLQELEEKLRQLDPLAAESVDLKNRRRVVRALEVCLLTGKPFSSFRTEWQQHPTAVCGVCITPTKEVLHQRIDARTRAMFEQGLVEEVGSLADLGPTASQVLGLKECRAFLRGAITREEAIEQMQRATRQYAKRQMTWFRREPSLIPVDPGFRTAEEVAAQVCGLVAPRHAEKTP